MLCYTIHAAYGYFLHLTFPSNTIVKVSCYNASQQTELQSVPSLSSATRE